MTYLHLALKAEALPLIQHLRLHLNSEAPCRIYSNETYTLTISLPGYDNALMATTALLSLHPPKTDDVFINIGLCAAPSNLAIGSLVGVHTLSFENERPYTLKPLAHLASHPLQTFKTEQSEALNTLADMEAFAAIKAASRFLALQQLSVIKVVSDHFKPNRLTKNSAQTLIYHAIDDIVAYIQTFKEQQCQPQ